jgi:hypothetical protein
MDITEALKCASRERARWFSVAAKLSDDELLRRHERLFKGLAMVFAISIIPSWFVLGLRSTWLFLIFPGELLAAVHFNGLGNQCRDVREILKCPGTSVSLPTEAEAKTIPEGPGPTTKPPTEGDWRGGPWDMEIPYAYDHFFGKSLQEAFALFVENALYYEEDLMWMPLPCFQYYVLAYTNYLLSESSRGDADGASCFFGLVEFRKDDIRGSSELVIGEIARTLEKLKGGQGWYGATEEIDGSFQERALACLKLIGAEPGAAPNCGPAERSGSSGVSGEPPSVS